MWILTLINIGLKLDKIAEMDWVAVFWPVWIVITCTMILSVGSILLITLSICSFYYKESSISDIYSSIWIFFSAGIGSVSFSLFFYDLFHKGTGRMCIWIIAYFLIFILITQLLKVHLLKWWRSLFVQNEQISIPHSLSNSGPLPIPASQLQHIRFSTKIIRAFRLPPRALVRMSSTYFQPAGPVREHAKVARTMSHDIKQFTRENIHFRSLSNASRERSLATQKSLVSLGDQSSGERKCSICCENEANAVLMDCGHGGICINCSNALIRNGGGCHMCRAQICQILKIRGGNSEILSVVWSNMNMEP